MLTNLIVQEKLQAAVTKLGVLAAEEKDEVGQQVLTLLQTTLALLKLYSASGNEHPGLRGLGLEEALDWADRVLEEKFTAAHIKYTVSGMRFDFKSMLPLL